MGTGVELPAWLVFVSLLFTTLAGIITAAAVIFKRIGRPLAHEIIEWRRREKTLEEIAEQFRPNHGTSLRDAIDGLTERADRARQAAEDSVAKQAALETYVAEQLAELRARANEAADILRQQERRHEARPRLPGEERRRGSDRRSRHRD